MPINSNVANVTNYLVPAAGQTHAVTISGTFTATPYPIDWRQFSVDNFPFSPQGVFVDNSGGAGPLTITILPIGYNVVCPAGAVIQAQFPAPNGQTAQIVGDGQATCFFVDFPVLPGSNASSGSGDQSSDVVVTGATNSGSPVFVSLPINDAGLPYQVAVTPAQGTPEYIALTTATSGTVTPPANANIRRAKVTISANAALATAGTDVVSVTLDGVVIAKFSPYIGTATGTAQQYDFDFANTGFSSGTSGTLELSIATALTAGTVELNAYFD